MGCALWILPQLFHSCKKEDKVPPSSNFNATSRHPDNRGIRVYTSSDEGIKLREGGLKRTVLGQARVNPFTVANMEAAYTELYGSDTTFPTTDLYIRFLPTTDEHMKALTNSGLPLMDFPLERKVIEMGDYYQLEGEGVAPALYSVVKPGTPLPDVPFEVIDELYQDFSDPLLVATSLYLTGNADEIQSVIPPIYPGTAPYEDLEAPCGDDFVCDPGCKVKIEIDDSTYPFKMVCVCDCSGDDGVNLNCCGDFAAPGHPSGCVRVDDTRLSTNKVYDTYLGVRRVKVRLWNGWFKWDDTFTDDNGCWQADKSFKSFFMWIRFVNDRHKIRVLSSYFKTLNVPIIGSFTLPVINYSDPVTHYVDHFTSVPHEIRVYYDRWTSADFGTRKHVYWGSATVNNANHDMHDYTADDGINSPPGNLDILLSPINGGGMTLMTSKHLGAKLLKLLFPNPFNTHPLNTLSKITPDVYIGIGELLDESDWLKDLSYHELSHAAHFTQVHDVYWDLLINAEIAAYLGTGNPHGMTGNGIIAVCESWAEHLANTYTHKTYGGHGRPPDQNTWEEYLETTWNESPGHVPIGLYHDLIDGGVEPESCNRFGGGCVTIDDQVEGFTLAQMFSCLTPTTLTTGNFISRLIRDHLASTNNTRAEVLALFNDY